jgi:hypothetical protein
MTAQNASGTAVDFTGIPVGVKRITVVFNGISATGTAIIQVQLGSGSLQTSGYSCVSGYGAYSSTSGGTISTGFPVTSVAGWTGIAGNILYGSMFITLLGSNSWTSQSSVAITGGSYQGIHFGAGGVTLSGAVDRLRLTTNGADTFDAGSVNVLYE